MGSGSRERARERRMHVRICIHKARVLRKRRDFTRRGTPPSPSVALSCAVINYRVTRSGHLSERKTIGRGIKVCFTYDRFSIATSTVKERSRRIL